MPNQKCFFTYAMYRGCSFLWHILKCTHYSSVTLHTCSVTLHTCSVTLHTCSVTLHTCSVMPKYRSAVSVANLSCRASLSLSSLASLCSAVSAANLSCRAALTLSSLASLCSARLALGLSPLPKGYGKIFHFSAVAQFDLIQLILRNEDVAYIIYVCIYIYVYIHIYI